MPYPNTVAPASSTPGLRNDTMSKLNDYEQRIKVRPESGFGWRRIALVISVLVVLAIVGFLFTSYPLEIIILLLFVGSVLLMERR